MWVRTEMKIGPKGKSYEARSFVREGGEVSVLAYEMMRRAECMSGHECLEEDGLYLLDNQQDIPHELRSYCLVIQDWRNIRREVAYLQWNGFYRCWQKIWRIVDNSVGRWDGSFLVIRRID